MTSVATALRRSLSSKVVALSFVTLLYAAAPAEADEGAFCERGTAVDYAAGLSAMPSIRHIPAGGRLPFLPKAISLNVTEEGLLVWRRSHGDPVKISFRVDDSWSGRLHIHLSVKATLTRIDRAGRNLSPPSVRELRLKQATPRQLKNALLSLVPVSRGYYRLTLSFADGQKLLGHYGSYFHVVQAASKADVVIERSAVVAGENLLFRTDNLGTEKVVFMLPFSVERKVDGGWESVSLPLGPWYRRRLALRAGSMGPCQTFDVPPDLAPGYYRIQKDLSGAVDEAVSPPFQVLASH